MQSNRISAVLAYLLLIFGWVYVFVARKEDKLAVYHAKQSITIILLAIAALVSWLIITWILMLVPYVGPVVGIAVFGLVIASHIFLFFTWIRGMIDAWQAKTQPLPVVGKWAARLPIG
ncbi:MAG: hypothetical protein ACPGWR_26755 [Ardenticatenaceae bacterium]